MESFFSRQSPPSLGVLPLLAIHVATEYYRLPRKPPVTAALIAVNTLIYTKPGVLDSILPSLDEVWFNPHLIVKYMDAKRFFLSPFYHMTDSHLVYNMISLLWKGVYLESAMGTTEFAPMVGVLLCLSQGCTLLLSKALLLLGHPSPYFYHYSVGFSGLLFALKVVLNSEYDGLTSVHGILLPSAHAAWAELILVQMFVPGVSFLGHLGGVLAGLLYLRLKSIYPGSTPLTALLRGLCCPVSALGAALSWTVGWTTTVFRAPRLTGRRLGGSAGEPLSWECGACTYWNSRWLGACEMCGSSRNRAAPGWVSREEMRLRRVRRFVGS